MNGLELVKATPREKNLRMVHDELEESEKCTSDGEDGEEEQVKSQSRPHLRSG